MLASFASRFASMVMQPTVAAVGAGVLAGAIAGTALVSAGVPFAKPTPPPTVSLQACPGTGPVLAHVAGGQTLLVTARSKDGAWLEVYLGEPAVDRAWAPASALTLQASAASLPVGGCEGVPLPSPTAAPTPPPGVTPSPAPAVTAVVTPEISPTPGPTPKPGTTPSPTPPPTATPRPTVTATPIVTPAPTITVTPSPTIKVTPSPTIKVTPSPTPLITPPPDTTPPSITSVSIADAYTNGDGNYYIYPAGSGCGFPSATISVSVTDSGGSGLAGYTVRLYWKDFSGTLHSQQMAYSLSTFRYTRAIAADAAWPDGYVEYWVTASDNAGNLAETSHPPDGSHWLFKGSTCIL